MCRLVLTWAPHDYLNRAHLHGRLSFFNHQNTTKNNKHSNINTPFYKTQALSSTIQRLKTFSHDHTTENYNNTQFTMSLFTSPRYYSAEPNFGGLFRLIDDWDRHVQQQGGDSVSHRQGARHLPLISPKFDLKETEGAYELHGELPGIEKDRVSIEFSDEQTLVVRGSIERSYTSDNSKSEGGDVPVGDNQQKPHKVTVEDDTGDNKGEGGDKSVEKSASQGAPVPAPKHKYWVSERSFGEFSRSFAFPGRVDTEGVNASLNNGILTVVVPKAKKTEARRIAIN